MLEKPFSGKITRYLIIKEGGASDKNLQLALDNALNDSHVIDDGESRVIATKLDQPDEYLICLNSQHNKWKIS